LTHEFGGFSGLSPGAYLARAAPSNHSSID
jgi:hypothetical protein